MSDTLRRKRERQARRLLRVCLREFNASCLQGYVDAYEDGDLVDPGEGDYLNCALGVMRPGRHSRIQMIEDHKRAAEHVERVFEGWGLFQHTNLRDAIDGYQSWGQAPDEYRVTWIYEACVEELARRNSESVLSPEARFVEVAP